MKVSVPVVANLEVIKMVEVEADSKQAAIDLVQSWINDDETEFPEEHTFALTGACVSKMGEELLDEPDSYYGWQYNNTIYSPFEPELEILVEAVRDETELAKVAATAQGQ